MFLAGEINRDTNTVSSSCAHSVRTVSSGMKPGGLVLDNTDIVVDVGENGATIVMGQGNGVSMNRDDIANSLPEGDSSVGDHHIYYSNKSAGGGTLDVDMNASSSNLSTSPVENIYFPAPEDGHYKVYIRNFRDRTDGQASHYLVRVIVNGQERLFEGDIDTTGTEIVIFEFDYVGPETPPEPQPLANETLTDWLNQAGAGQGDITVSCAWDSADDLDLHVFTPNGGEIYWDNTEADGGILDIDANRSSDSVSSSPVENIYFADPVSGEYWVYIYNCEDRSSGSTNYIVRLSVGGRSETFSGTIDGEDSTIEITGFRY